MIVTTTPQTPLTQQKTMDFRMKYKTEKCRYWMQKGYCPFSESCTFAHSELQVRTKLHTPPNYKTKPCINFSTKGYCTYGERCQYLHLAPELLLKEEEGRETRSNSAESASSKSSKTSRHSDKPFPALTHHSKVQLIQTLGLDFAVRSSSRLMQLLHSNENISQYSPEQHWDYFSERRDTLPKNKKYSL